MVDNSPWPIVSSVVLGSLMVGSLAYLNGEVSVGVLITFMFCLAVVICLWWRDVIREATYLGSHTKLVQKGLELGFVLFILSEVMFFFSFFFGYFFVSLSPDVELGMLWPPYGLQFIDYKGLALTNTVLLLSSGFTITWGHYSILGSSLAQSKLSLIITILLALSFLVLQGFEYFNLSFTIRDSVFGSLFYIMTGFHGLHVVVGLVFITCSFSRLLSNHFSSSHHKGFEFSAWYWHFVDVVWLFLFVIVYWWNSPVSA